MRLSSLHDRSRGQALIWLLGTLATCAGLMLAVFSAGQLTVGKQRTDARQITLDSRDDFTQNRPGKGLFKMSSGFVG